mgnify:FL=1
MTDRATEPLEREDGTTEDAGGHLPHEDEVRFEVIGVSDRSDFEPTASQVEEA